MNPKDLESKFRLPVQFDKNYAIVNASSQFENQTQTNDSFSEKWVKLDAESSTSAFEKFQKDWVLKLYGFESEEGLRQFLKDKKVIVDAGCGLGYKAAWIDTEHSFSNNLAAINGTDKDTLLYSNMFVR